MTNPTFFTVVADFKSVVVDLASDVDADPTLGPVTGKVTFTPVLGKGDVILATDASPRPTGYVPAPIVARIDADGRLKLRVEPDGDRDDFANAAAFPGTGNTAKVYFAIDTQTFYRWTGSAYAETYPYAEVRLLADTALLELAGDLYYRVAFSEVVFNGGPGYIAPFTFQAPSTDVELNLIEVMRQPGQPASGITKIAPGSVRIEGDDLVFSFAGVDIPDPVPLGTFGATEVGVDLLTAEDAAAARAAISPGGVDPIGTPTAVKTAAYTAAVGDIVRSDATAGGFTITLPAAPASGSTIWVKKIDTTTNAVTVQRGNGTDVFNETNGPSLLQLVTPGETVALTYRSGIWHVVSHSFTVPGLDDRYVQQGLFPQSTGYVGSYSIKDSNGADSLVIPATENAVACFEMRNSITGQPVRLASLSPSQANVGIDIRTKGNGNILLCTASGADVARFGPNFTGSGGNSFTFWNAAPGTAPRIFAAGTEDNISINLVPRGAGKLQSNGVDVLLTGGALGTPSSGTLTNCTFPTLNQNTSGTAAGLSATLVVGSGGTGATTLTGLVKGNGTSAMTAAVAGTDFVAPGGALGTPSSGTLTNATGLPVSGITASTSAALGVGSLEIGHASDTTLTRSAAGVLAVEGVDLVNLSSTQTLSGKTLNGGTLSALVRTSSGIGVQFAHTNQTDNNDGLIAANAFASGLNIVGAQTVPGAGRVVRIFGGGGVSLITGAATAVSGAVQVSVTSNGSEAAAFGVTSTFTNSANRTYSALLNPTMSQTGTGGYTVLRINPTETSNTGSGPKLLIDAQLAGTSKFSVSNAGSVTLADSADLAVGTSTGTKIATATTQKLGFWNATPAVQPTAVADATDAASVITQVNALLSRLRTIGLIAT